MIGPGLLSDRELLRTQVNAADCLIVTNTTVARLYLATLRETLADRRLGECILPDGEQHKTLQSAGWVFDALVSNKLNRDATVIALGGGVIGDIAGFAAACYQRGIGYVQIPTTLLAQVDSAVGGKTGVNHSAGKNLIGAFHQPLAVITDTDTLATLPDRELRAGFDEQPQAGADFLHAHFLLASQPVNDRGHLGRIAEQGADFFLRAAQGKMLQRARKREKKK